MSDKSTSIQVASLILLVRLLNPIYASTYADIKHLVNHRLADLIAGKHSLRALICRSNILQARLGNKKLRNRATDKRRHGMKFSRQRPLLSQVLRKLRRNGFKRFLLSLLSCKASKHTASNSTANDGERICTHSTQSCTSQHTAADTRQCRDNASTSLTANSLQRTLFLDLLAQRIGTLISVLRERKKIPLRVALRGKGRARGGDSRRGQIKISISQEALLA